MAKRGVVAYAWLAVGAALATIVIKTAAYLITDSVGLLSDALESVVNLVSALLAVSVLRIAEQGPDSEHNYGHEKAEYFSSGVEGALILLAAAVVAALAVQRFFEPHLLERLNLGILFSLGASVLNLVVARILIRAGRRRKSIALEADGHHLMSDVWTSVGVLAGLAGVALTGRQWLDPLAALVVAAHIGWVGSRLVQRSVHGLMDRALSPARVQAVTDILTSYREMGVRYHALRTRRAGARSFVSVHIMVPGRWSVQKGHDLLEEIESRIRRQVPSASVFTHLEPVEDPLSQADVELDRDG
ncbi:MAG TPA: cation diffusion facilitator family transporter [Acidobacteriota bacterium]|nr:cation diffusion facilitator family transporter [Acidobacteriota bacterium]